MIHHVYIGLYTYYIHIIYIYSNYIIISLTWIAACSDHLIPRSPSVAVLAVCSSWGAARTRTTRDPLNYVVNVVTCIQVWFINVYHTTGKMNNKNKKR